MNYTITWIGQAGYILSSGKSKLVIDPYCSNSIESLGFKRLYPSPIPKGQLFVDFVISTHDHGDHLDIETLTDYIGFSRFYGPGSCVKALQDAGFANDKLHVLDRGQTIQIGDFHVTAVFANHTQDSIGLIVECEGIKCYFTGDSLFDKNLFEINSLNPDIIFTCINGKFGNMKWFEAVELSKQLKVRATRRHSIRQKKRNSELLVSSDWFGKSKELWDVAGSNR